MNLRDWLIIIGVVIIAGIVLDGFRRMRLARKDALKISLDMGGGTLDKTPLDDDYNPELPSGGARIVSKDAIDSGVVRISKKDIKKNKKPFSTAAKRKSNEAELPLSAIDDREEISSLSEMTITADSDARVHTQISIETVSSHPGKPAKKSVAEVQTSHKDKHALVLVINVHALTHQGFPGKDVKRLLEACGLDHGHMSIFHRHEEDDLLSPIQFSVANAIEPGYFDPETLDEISTPGVSFFMTLPGPKDYMKAFDYMLETAQCFARNLKGELKDENLSVMTPQTIEHCRQKIRDFKRLELSKNRLSS
jgi:cell division protein ZipA